MTAYIPAELRRLVEVRAEGICEYCLIHEQDTFLGFQIDHVISEKYGGATSLENLCLACAFCNRFKGTDVGSFSAGNGEFTRFFNPRTDCWSDHFKLNGVMLEHVTPIGEVTVAILGMNHRDRILERQVLQVIGAYPTAVARQRINPKNA